MSPGSPARKDDLTLGASLVVGACLLFAFMGAMIRAVSDDLPLEMVVFFRNFFGLVILSPWLLHAGGSGIRTGRFHLHAARTISGLAAMYCFFYALAHLELGEAVLLNFSAPLFIPVIASFWLGESLPERLWWALLVGLAGILLILKPTPGMLQPVALIGLASGLFAAVATVCVRDLSRTEPPERIVFYFAALATLVSSFPLFGNWHQPDAAEWSLLLGIGLLATVAQVLITRGIMNVPAAQVGPFAYSTVLFAALIGWYVWGELPDTWSLAGGLMVIAGGVLILHGSGKPARDVKI